ncbi:serine/threonine-protein kinase [Kribbella catacumbae]|uniref:serine/threonine-protein kinase n=1 Tax=Kribbella catacumbae TaxID=460086 RepID=UPI00058FA9D6|nr:serine/threonine-protein kinase [Kribbella catacumbae]
MRPAEDVAGLVAERYRLHEPLGRGGMGEVYRATDEVRGREVAIKLLLPRRESLAADERFEREARAAAMVTDPHVVAAYDYGPHDDGFYLAMELVEGRTVSEELCAGGPMEADRAVGIIRQAAAGLAAAHKQGLVHRDIKPGNLLLTSDGTVKVADFGIVRLLSDTTTTLTATGQIVGTSHYLAPERALGEPAEAASDIYALGCVLYQLVTGHPPFMAENPASIMYQHVETMPVPPSDLRPRLAGEFEALLFWLLAKDPADRPTAAEVAAEATPPALSATLALPVRRPSPRNVLVGAGAVLAFALLFAMGILLDAKSVKIPATNDLSPDSGATTPAVVPSVRPPSISPTSPRVTAPPPKTSAAVSQPSQADQSSESGKSPKDKQNKKSGKPGKN